MDLQDYLQHEDNFVQCSNQGLREDFKLVEKALQG